MKIRQREQPLDEHGLRLAVPYGHLAVWALGLSAFPNCGTDAGTFFF